MSTVKDALQAIKAAANLLDEMKKVGETLKEVSAELSNHDRRLCRLEAKWETMMEIAAIQGAKSRTLVEQKES